MFLRMNVPDIAFIIVAILMRLMQYSPRLWVIKPTCCLVVAGNKSQREELDSILFIFEVSETVFYSSETASVFFCGVTLQLHLLLRTTTPRTNSFICSLAICSVPVCACIAVLTSAASALMSNGHSKEPHPVSPECTGCTSSANVHPHLHLSEARLPRRQWIKNTVGS